MAEHFSLKPHELKKGSGGRTLLVATHPYVRLSSREGVVYLQHGKFWGEGGDEITDVPGWATAAANNLSPKAAAEVGWGTSSEEGVQILNDEEADLAIIPPNATLDHEQTVKGTVHRKPVPGLKKDAEKIAADDSEGKGEGALKDIEDHTGENQEVHHDDFEDDEFATDKDKGKGKGKGKG